MLLVPHRVGISENLCQQIDTWGFDIFKGFKIFLKAKDTCVRSFWERRKNRTSFCFELTLSWQYNWWSPPHNIASLEARRRNLKHFFSLFACYEYYELFIEVSIKNMQLIKIISTLKHINLPVQKKKKTILKYIQLYSLGVEVSQCFFVVHEVMMRLSALV